MRTILFTCLLGFLFAVPALAQKDKPWTEWSKKDTEKLLNDSSWGQTYTKDDSTPTGGAVTQVSSNGGAGRAISANPNAESGDVKASKAIKYRVRFITAKPIREAISRWAILSAANPSKELEAQLQGFVDRDFGDLLVVGVTVESEDPKMAAGIMQGFSRFTPEMLKDKVYLERKDGKRAPIVDYKAPVQDGMGGKFVFARTIDGQPFLSPESDSVKFVFELNEKTKFNVKYKVSTMMYGGKLEY